MMGWTDAALMDAAGTPCVIFGPDGEGAHALVEYADIESVVRCAQVLVRMASEFCA
jgi:acetylornithine deacetylase